MQSRSELAMEVNARILDINERMQTEINPVTGRMPRKYLVRMRELLNAYKAECATGLYINTPHN